MRAHWMATLPLQQSYQLQDEAFHHLVHVVRIEENEELLLLDGKGLEVTTIVDSVTKREIRLLYTGHSSRSLSYHFDLALGIPKRDALDLCLKQATELGFRRIYLIKSAYSQMKVPEMERVGKLLVAALEQSNAPFLPEIHPLSWSDIPWGEYEEALLLDSQTKGKSQILKIKDGRKLLIVGPEGGFSPEEINFLHSVSNLRALKLPTPLLRTPTAVAAGAGILIENLLK
jgi:16S rRNA (uracil1498-N3)-methyltransferase